MGVVNEVWSLWSVHGEATLALDDSGFIVGLVGLERVFEPSMDGSGW